MEKNPLIILFLNQTIADLDRYCPVLAPFTFFLSVPDCLTLPDPNNFRKFVCPNTLKRPWFPGVCIFQREAFEDFFIFSN